MRLVKYQHSFIPLAAGLFLLPCAADYSTDYTTGRVFVTETNLSLSMETVESSFMRDGEPVEGRGGQGGSSSLEQHLLVRDHVLGQEDGTPTSLRRSFEVVEGDTSRSFGDQEMDQTLESPFAGLLVEMTAEDGELSFDILDGDLSDEELLQGQTMPLTLDALLPTESVEPGDTWELESTSIARALLLNVQSNLFPAPEPSEDEGTRGGRRGGRGGPRGRNNSALGLLIGADWEGEATLLSVNEASQSDEITRIQFKAEAEGVVEGGGGGRGPREGSSSGETTYSLQLKGELVYSESSRRPVSLEIEGTLGRTTDRSFERGETSMSIYREEAGTFEMSVNISEGSDDD